MRLRAAPEAPPGAVRPGEQSLPGRERRRPSPAEAARRLMYAHIQHSGDLIADHLTAQH
ncbi:hypothetical protein [Streptomyces sp. NPDC056634]|uniref:hypothetical protein n=1 Tax=Streptomyces sp. NPDC056634 TaxID=3345885 RepID=UPI0036CCCA88